jgi:ankyrin repeat protein
VNTTLAKACKKGHVNLVEELVKTGANINLNVGDVGRYLSLITACKKGLFIVVK